MNTKLFEEQLSTLVKLPSMSCTSPSHDQSNHAVIIQLSNWLEDLGFECDIQAIDNNPGKYNLVATKGTGSKGLVLSGHTDTVPCNPELWQQDPFSLSNRDNRFYGLGATDMKGFFPVILAAIKKMADAKLSQPIIVLATADEESSMSGARALTLSQFPSAQFAVIGEPTNLRPIRMHKGMMMESVRVQGKAGHSSNPALGNNALETMNHTITSLLKFRSKLQYRYQNPGFDIAVPTLNLGCIHGGDNPNRICSSCEMHFDLRPLPGMSLEQLRNEIQSELRPVAEKSGCDIVFHSLFPGIQPFEQAATSKLVSTAEALTGHKAKSVAFATEAPFLQNLGMETIVMGPGSIDQAHLPNEFIAHEQIEPAIKVISQLIEHFCVLKP